MDALVDELLLERGVERADVARHRDHRMRDFRPDPCCFAEMD
jgi:single-stranded-DNA-specific exonuclease